MTTQKFRLSITALLFITVVNISFISSTVKDALAVDAIAYCPGGIFCRSGACACFECLGCWAGCFSCGCKYWDWDWGGWCPMGGGGGGGGCQSPDCEPE